MRPRPTAMGWLHLPASPAPDWQRAQIRRLSRHLGFLLVWAPDVTVIPLVDIVRAEDVDTLIIPSPEHVTALGLNALLSVADVETVVPRLSFHRWGLGGSALTVTEHNPSC